MSEHTKTPWAMHDNGSYFDIGVPTQNSVLKVYPTVMIGVDYCNEANARHIVHCVNNHEKLVEALGELLDKYEDVDLAEPEPEELITAVRIARTLLAELEANND